MGLSNDLISKFVKITNDNKKEKKETFAYATVSKVEVDGEITQAWVKLDGADEETPLSRVTDVVVGDRVIVMVKNHAAVITGNLTNPSARYSQVQPMEKNVTDAVNKANAASQKANEASNAVAEFQQVIAEKASLEQLYAAEGRIKTLETDNVTINKKVTAAEGDIEQLTADNVEINEKVTAAEGKIQTLESDNVTINETLTAQKGNIDELTADNVEINNKITAAEGEIDDLKATHGEFETLTTSKFEALDARIEELDVGKLTAKDIEGKYANIDFSNIGQAAIEQFFSKSGMISDLVVGDGTITGKLVGVTISGDLIEGNTVKAEKLVVKGSDGLYYKLNIEAGATTSEEVSETDLQNGLHGTAIIAKTITAEKISVDDLVAFGATIGGFKISENSLYSGVKSSVDNTTEGIYLDSTGQMSVGDSNNFFRYYLLPDGTRKLEITGSSVILKTSQKTVESAVEEIEASVNTAQNTANEANTKADDANALIAQLKDSISMLVTDGNGTSLMTQTEDGWMFSTAEIQTLVDRISEGLDSLTKDVGDVGSTVDILKQAVDDLGTIAEYVKIGTYEDEPCIELGEGDSEFKLRITNTRMIFTEGSNVLAYFNNQSLHIKKAVVEEELQQGGFVWKIRSNGNLALVWKGGDE